MTVKLNAATGGGSVSLSAPNSTTSNADVTLTLPVDDGDANEFLQTNGSGTLSFAVPANLGTAATASGTNLQFNSGYGSVATAYGCRAWVNFNGTGTVAIRASGNVSSITDNGTGDYTVNFTTAMPDANYATTSINDTPTWISDGLIGIGTAAAGSVQIRSTYIYDTSRGSYDQDQVNVAVFR